MNFKKFVYKQELGNIKRNEYFKNITTMKVGGKIKYLFYPNNVNCLKEAICYLNENKIKYIFMGNGSNIIASDNFFNGVVISSKFLPHTMNIDNDVISVTAFYDLRRLVSFTVSRDIDTFTKLAGIPATIGGAIYMNASANNCAISENLIDVTFIKNNKIYTRKKEDIKFDYRHTEFMDNNCIILEASFKIIKKVGLIKEYNSYLEKRRNSHPTIFPNSGSIFRNLNNKKAYEVIKEIDMAGYTKGRAQVSMKHCNFIINTGNAKGNDIYKIINLIKKLAFKKQYNLREEVILFNFKK